MSQQAAGLLCPACRVNLVMSERNGVEIDYCPQCRGVWLDRGELDKILDRAASEFQGRSASPPPQGAPRMDRPFGKHDSDEYPAYGHQGKPYKRKSFLHDLFD